MSTVKFLLSIMLIMRLLLVMVLLLSPVFAEAAKVILKNGKTFYGRIVAENEGDVLIKTNPVNRPKLIPREYILSIVRDPTPEVILDPQRYIGVGLRLQADIPATNHIELNAAPAMALDGAFRFHPLIELGAELDWVPGVTGEVAMTDGTNTRSYESFYAYGGGLSARLFPFYTYKWKIEPFLSLGYRWSNLVPKGSGDMLKGEGLTGGIGAQWPWKKNLFLQGGLLYYRGSYGTAKFLNRTGALDPHIRSDVYSLFTALAWHVL